jgi:hypothetical protein
MIGRSDDAGAKVEKDQLTEQRWRPERRMQPGCIAFPLPQKQHGELILQRIIIFDLSHLYGMSIDTLF